MQYLTLLNVKSLQHFLAMNDIGAENVISHKYVVLNGRGTFNAISKIVGNSVLVPIQNSVKGFLAGIKNIFIYFTLKSRDPI